MPRIIDRTTGRYLGTLNDQECKQLIALFDEPTRTDEFVRSILIGSTIWLNLAELLIE